MIGETDVQNYGPGPVLQCEVKALLGRRRHQTVELHFLGELAQDLGERLVIFHDQKGATCGARAVAIVVDLLFVAFGRFTRRCRNRRDLAPSRRVFDEQILPGSRLARLSRARLKIGGQRQRERAAHLRFACQAQLASEEPRKLPRDRQPQTCAALFAMGRTVSLSERLEDELLLIGRNSDARVGDGEFDAAIRRLARA